MKFTKSESQKEKLSILNNQSAEVLVYGRDNKHPIFLRDAVIFRKKSGLIFFR